MQYVSQKDIKIDQLKDTECLDKRNIWIDESIEGNTEFMFYRMIDKIISLDKGNGIEPENAKPINIICSSWGGCVVSTLSIISKIESVKKMGYQVHGYAYAKCMSGAFKIFISCSKRYAIPTCDLMCHQPNGFTYGYKTMEDDKRRYLSTRRYWERCKDIILKYTNLTSEILDEHNENNKDFHVWADESIEKDLGIVDELI